LDDPGKPNRSDRVVNSSSFIDASVFIAHGSDFCAVLTYMLNPTHGVIPSGGAVVDARGLNSNVTSMTCAASPWAGITGPPPATVLLPAGTIVIQHPGWILPPNTRVIGVGNDDVATGTSTVTSGTIIQACKGGQTGCSLPFAAGDTIITMCNSSCSGVSVENLSLDGQG
jgi:hypothetical protein